MPVEKSTRLEKKYEHRPQYALLGSYCALAGVSLLILLKSYAYYQSGSAALLGTLVDSIVDIAVSLMLFFAVTLSLKPADEDHRDGHGKAEGIASLFQGAFMSGAGVFLAFEATTRFSNMEAVKNHDIAIAVAIISIVVSLIIILVQRFSLKYAPSLAVEADYHHYKTDIFLNLTVLIALVISFYGGPLWVDPVFALLIAGYFLFTAFGIIESSVDMLMDREVTEEVREHIREIVAANPDIHGMHDLRTRMSGMKMHISFDAELEPEMSLKKAHDIVHELDHAILEHYPNAEIIIHMDPIGHTEDPRHTVQGIHH